MGFFWSMVANIIGFAIFSQFDTDGYQWIVGIVTGVIMSNLFNIDRR